MLYDKSSEGAMILELNHDTLFFSFYSHDSNPYIPDIAGMDEFQGRKIHSKWFRFEEHFDGLKVAVLGCHFSGEDISMLVAKFAKKVKDI